MRLTLIALIVAALALFGCSSATTPPPVASAGHGGYGGSDIFSAGSQVQGAAAVSVSAALAKTAPGVRVPTTLGTPTAIYTPGAGQVPQERVPLCMLYANGVKFFAFPGSNGDAQRDHEATQFAPFTDGRTHEYDLVTIGGITYEVGRPGTQVISDGPGTLNGRQPIMNPVYPVVMYYVNGVKYELEAPQTATNSVDATQLLTVAQGVK